MTYPIEIKSIGTLIDEYITARLKTVAKVEKAQRRANDLYDAITSRLPAINWHIDCDVRELQDVSLLCWDAQNDVMDATGNRDVAVSARVAQATNAKRNVLIRKIDEKWGDEERTPLEKTYI